MLSAAWPRYITLSGYGIETRHLIKEYRREGWEERSRTRAAETQTEKTSRMQKQGGITAGKSYKINAEKQQSVWIPKRRKRWCRLMLQKTEEEFSCRELCCLVFHFNDSSFAQILYINLLDTLERVLWVQSSPDRQHCESPCIQECVWCWLHYAWKKYFNCWNV